MAALAYCASQHVPAGADRLCLQLHVCLERVSDQVRIMLDYGLTCAFLKGSPYASAYTWKALQDMIVSAQPFIASL